MIESYKKYHNIKNERFLFEGIFFDFMRKKNLTPLEKFKRICKENKKNFSVAEYTFFNSEYRDSRKSYKYMSDEKIISFLKRKNVLYFPEYETFYIISEYKTNLNDKNLKFLSKSKVEKNSLSLDDTVKKLFPIE